jgi:uncharacterized protein (TIRG00374 family)
VSLSLPAACGLELAMNGLWSLAPAAPAEGLVYGTRQLRRRGLDGTHAALTLGFEQWFSYRIIYLVAALNILVILARRDFPVTGPTPVLGAVAVLLLLLASAYAARQPAVLDWFSRLWGRLRFWAPRPSASERRQAALRLHASAMSVVGTKGNRVLLVILSLVAHLSGVATLLFALRAAGVTADFDVVLLASAAAVVVSSVPLLPAGLGVVEAVIPGVLHWYGAPWDQALAGAIVARLVGTVLPALLGAGALVALRAPGQDPP